MVQHLQSQSTERMEILNRNVEKEAIVVRIITIVTLIYLPATLISVGQSGSRMVHNAWHVPDFLRHGCGNVPRPGQRRQLLTYSHGEMDRSDDTIDSNDARFCVVEQKLGREEET